MFSISEEDRVESVALVGSEMLHSIKFQLPKIYYKFELRLENTLPQKPVF